MLLLLIGEMFLLMPVAAEETRREKCGQLLRARRDNGSQCARKTRDIPYIIPRDVESHGIRCDSHEHVEEVLLADKSLVCRSLEISGGEEGGTV